MTDTDHKDIELPHRPIRIGTRGSPLALWQARTVAAGLEALAPGRLLTEIVVIRTTGDKEQGRRLSEIGGKGLFTKEIEDALLDGSLDCAVHSLKDMPTVLPEGLELAATLPRADPADALITRDGCGIGELPPGAVLGTASLRRQAQMLIHRPDLKVTTLRGNVETRLRKLNEGEVDATLLAEAGLQRLGRDDVPRRVLGPETMLPAVAQGAVTVEIRADRAEIRQHIERLDDQETSLAVRAERAMLAVLDGSCRTPIAALARRDGSALHLEGLMALPDGSECHRLRETGSSDKPEALGRALGERLLDAAGPDFRQRMERWM